MKSAWTSIRAFVVVVAMLGFGGTLCYLAVKGNEAALGALIAFVGALATYYFASPTGASGNPHGPAG